MTEYQPHPAAELFPMMSDAELRELADDIKANGLMDRIVIHDGMILDGRNRYAACSLAGVEPQFTNPQPPISSPTVYVVSKNVHRRHLTVGQRAAIAAEMMPMLRDEAKKRQATSTGGSEPKPIQLPVNSPEAGLKGDTRKIAGEVVGVGEWSVQRAANLKRDDPETFEKVKRGEITINAAATGHKTQPQIGGNNRDKAAPYEANTPRKRQLAEAQKRKMIDGLSLVSGVCRGLTDLDVAMTAAACTTEEIETWATKAENHARDLRRFAVRLRGTTNGELEPCADGAAAGR